MEMKLCLSLFGFGILVFGYYRLISKKNVILQKAHAKNIRDIEINDDVWISGIIETDEKLIAPFFGYETVYYHYRKTPVHYQNTVNKDSKILNETKSVSVVINDKSGKITIQLKNAEKSEVFQERKIEGQFIHEIEYIPARGLLSAVGIVGPQKKELIAKGEVSLLVTPLGFKQYLMKSKQKLQPLRLTGISFLWLGFILSLSQFIQLGSTNAQLKSAIGMVVGLCLPAYFYLYSRILDRMLHLRNEVYTVWNQLDEWLIKRRRIVRKLVQMSNLKQYTNEQGYLSGNQILELIENIGLEKRYLPRIQMENEFSVEIRKLKESIHSQLSRNLKSLQYDSEFKVSERNELIEIYEQLQKIENEIDHKSINYLDAAKEYNHYIRTWYVENIAHKLFFEPVLYFGELKANLEILQYMKKIPQRKNDLRANQASLLEKRAQLVVLHESKKAS